MSSLILIVVGVGIVIGIFALSAFLSFVQAHVVASMLTGNNKSALKWTSLAFLITAVLATGSYMLSLNGSGADGGLVFLFFYILTVPLGIFTVYLQWNEKINILYLFLGALGTTVVCFLVSFNYTSDLVTYVGYTALIATFATGLLGLILLFSRATGPVNSWIIFWLIFFFPVGLYLLWRSEAKISTKIIVTALILGLCFALTSVQAKLKGGWADRLSDDSPRGEPAVISDYPLIDDDTLAQAMAGCKIEAVYIPTRGDTGQAGVCVEGKAYLTSKVLMIKTYIEELEKASPSACKPPRLNTGSTIEEYIEFMPKDCGFNAKK